MELQEKKLKKATVDLSATIQDAISSLNESSLQIVLVVKENGQLVGTVSDGDVRRGLLRGLSLTDQLSEILHSTPLVVPPEIHSDSVLQLMSANKIHQIPIVDSSSKVIGMHLWDELSSPSVRENLVVIMAGGKGTRLGDLTKTCPKPMIRVSDRPILEHIIDRAKNDGFTKFVLSVNYLSHVIEEYFGDGSRFGVEISYLREDEPLGTAGALSLMTDVPKLPFVVTNGDVISDIKYGDLLDFHGRHDATATMAVSLHEWQHPFGVVETEGVTIVGFEEKPVSLSRVNAGVYAISPQALNYLESDCVYDMPELFNMLKDNFELIVAFPMHEPWLDVGRPNDLAKAQSSL